MAPFWSSVDLTGNQTQTARIGAILQFWSSVDLTGNQTGAAHAVGIDRFGAVSI